MLTVRHVEKDGHEGVTEASSVHFDPAIGANREYPNGQVVAFGVPEHVADGCNRYANGVIYVMNENGSTVARFNLD